MTIKDLREEPPTLIDKVEESEYKPPVLPDERIDELFIMDGQINCADTDYSKMTPTEQEDYRLKRLALYETLKGEGLL